MSFNFKAICNLNPFDGNIVRAQIDNVLKQRNFRIENYSTVIEYLDAVTNQFKASFHRDAENGTFDLGYSGFYIEQMLLSCL